MVAAGVVVAVDADVVGSVAGCVVVVEDGAHDTNTTSRHAAAPILNHTAFLFINRYSFLLECSSCYPLCALSIPHLPTRHFEALYYALHMYCESTVN